MTMNRVSRNVAAMYQDMVRECAGMYGFDAEEAILRLDLSMSKKVSKKVSVEKVVREKVVREKTVPLPFDACCVDASKCQGLKPNHGLYTQCPNSKTDSSEYCSGCKKQCDKNDGKLPAGTVDDRISQGAEFKDGKGKRPVHFTKVMKKLNLSREMVMEFAGKMNVEVNEDNFNEPEKKGKGRPKKSKSVVAASSDDVFAELAMENASASQASTLCEEEDEVSSLSGNESDNSKVSKGSKGSKKMSAEEKAAKEAEKAEKKAAKEAEKAEKKAAKEAEMAEKKAAKEAEMAEKKAAKEAEKAEKKAAKEAEKAEKKAAKEAEKAKKASKEVAPAPAPVPASDNSKKVVAKKFTHNGVVYAKSGDGRVFDLTTKEFLGNWDEDKKEIIYCSDDEDSDEEEEEEEEEEDDE